jgi:hypothetical protein
LLLTPEAVTQLGGVDDVIANAPVERCQPIEIETGVSLLCRVAPQPADAPLEAWSEWRSYLAPVLRIGRWDDMPLSFRDPWILEEDWYRRRPHNGQGVPVEYDRSMFQPADPYLDL